MSGALGALVIHGIGTPEENFADGLIEKIGGQLGARASRVVWQPIFWSKALNREEDDFDAAMKSAVDPSGEHIPLRWSAVRKFVVHNLGDAVAYQREPERAAYTRINHIVSTKIGELKQQLDDPTAPIVVLAHSLGGHIMSSYIWDRQHPNARGGGPAALEPLPTLVGMVTFGCNIPLLALALNAAVPIDVPGPGVTKPALVTASRWLNFLDADDVLGWPLRPLYGQAAAKFTPAQQVTFSKLEDYEINAGNILESWNPASHDGYWTDRDFVTPAAAFLATLLDALDA
jgi:hypothetical protein